MVTGRFRMKFIKTLESREEKIKELDEIRDVLKNYSVRLGYLFGSFSKGEITKFSDIDIGILFEPDAEKKIDKLRMNLSELLGEEAIDLIDLEKAPPKLTYNIVKEGKLLIGEDFSKDFEIKAMKKYFDFKPVEDLYFQKMKERIECGEYGR